MDIVTQSIQINPYFGQTVLIVDDQSFNLFAVGQLLQLLQIPYLTVNIYILYNNLGFKWGGMHQ